MSFRSALLNLHLCAGLIAAVFLLILGVTGSIMVFEDEIDHALNARLTWVTPAPQRLLLTELKSRLEKAYPGYQVGGFGLSTRKDIAYSAFLASAALHKGFGVAFDQYTGRILGTSDESNNFTGNLHQFHLRLLAGRTGATILGWVAVFLLFLSISGLILWWPRKIFQVNWHASGRRITFDLHNALGIYSSVFLLLFSLTAIVIHWEEPASKLAERLTNSPPQQRIPDPSPPPPGAVPLDPETLLGIAQKTAPGARATVLALAGDPREPVRIIMKYPEDGTPAGRTNIYLDAYAGKILFAQTSRNAPVSFKIVKLWNREIHTGDIFGWPTRILASFFSLMLPVMAITGPLIWWQRRRKGAESPEPAGQPRNTASSAS